MNYAFNNFILYKMKILCQKPIPEKSHNLSAISFNQYSSILFAIIEMRKETWFNK